MGSAYCAAASSSRKRAGSDRGSRPAPPKEPKAARGARQMSSIGMGVSGRPNRPTESYTHPLIRLCATDLRGLNRGKGLSAAVCATAQIAERGICTMIRARTKLS
jgi:hypothetical protein